ncbi:MAG: hypothetical protein ACC660_04600 [Acidimicrobiales bacterium]
MTDPTSGADAKGGSHADTVPNPWPGIVVNLLLCDAAQVAAGRLSLLGGGLTVIGPKPQPMAMAIHISVPWDRANVRHGWELELVDEDGHPVHIKDVPVVARGHFEAGRPAGLRPGSSLAVTLAINLAPIPLAPGRAFQFRFSVEGESKPGWAARFSTRSGPLPPH